MQQNLNATLQGLPSSQDLWSPPEGLVELGNALIVDLTAAFRENTVEYLERMRDSLAAADFDRVRAEAHRIKGSASQLGADTMAKVCQEMELAAQARAAAQLNALYGRLNGLFTEVCDEMAAYALAHPED